MKRLPKKGTEVIGWKKVDAIDSGDRYLVQLLIPADAERVMPKGTDEYDINDDNKCRAEYAVVLGMWRLSPWVAFTPAFSAKDARSLHDSSFAYRVGKVVRPDSFDPSDETCSNGINFFLDPEEALAY